MLSVKVLVDNTTIIDKYLMGEPALSLWIECGGKRLLFDAGYSGLFLRNAYRMGIDAAAPDAVVLSHGHNDHSWGLHSLVKEREVRGLAGKPPLFCHPDALLRKRFDGADIGVVMDIGALENFFALRRSRAPVEIAEKLFWLGEIEPRIEPRKALGETLRGGSWEPDFCADDSAVVYDGADGLVVITGCSHSGICNIIEQAMTVTGKEKIADTIGGFHLMDGSPQEAAPVLSYLEKAAPAAIHTCHCTCFRAKAALAASFNVGDVGSGSQFDFA